MHRFAVSASATLLTGNLPPSKAGGSILHHALEVPRGVGFHRGRRGRSPLWTGYRLAQVLPCELREVGVAHGDVTTVVSVFAGAVG